MDVLFSPNYRKASLKNIVKKGNNLDFVFDWTYKDKLVCTL